LKLNEELDRARRRLETIDFYTNGKDYQYCLSGIWSIVSIFDSQERENFLSAIEKEEIPKIQDVSRMVENYRFNYK